MKSLFVLLALHHLVFPGLMHPCILLSLEGCCYTCVHIMDQIMHQNYCMLEDQCTGGFHNGFLKLCSLGKRNSFTSYGLECSIKLVTLMFSAFLLTCSFFIVNITVFIQHRSDKVHLKTAGSEFWSMAYFQQNGQKCG